MPTWTFLSLTNTPRLLIVSSALAAVVCMYLAIFPPLAAVTGRHSLYPFVGYAPQPVFLFGAVWCASRAYCIASLAPQLNISRLTVYGEVAAGLCATALSLGYFFINSGGSPNAMERIGWYASLSVSVVACASLILLSGATLLMSRALCAQSRGQNSA